MAKMIDQVHPDMQEIFKPLPQLPFHHRWLIPVLRSMVKKMGASSKILKGVETCETQAHTVPLKVYEPIEGGNGAAMLWIHGGGYMVGTPDQDNEWCSRYSQTLGITVLSVDYRLAPEHPFPLPLDDCFTAWLWLLENADSLGVDPHRIVVAGASAGGGLAACLVHRIADHGGIQPAAQALIYPMLDELTGLELYQKKQAVHVLWDKRHNVNGWRSYLGQKPDPKADVPAYAVAARREDLSGLPPAWIGTGDIDLFYEEDKHYAQRLNEAGVDTEFDVLEKAPHGFPNAAYRVPVVKAYFENHFAFLRKHLQLSSE